MLNKTWPADVNWSWGKCGTGQGDSSKGASPSGWKTPTGVEFARSPVFNTTSSSLLVKQIRLHAVLWCSEMSAFVLARVWRLQLDWIGGDTQCERSRVWPPCGVKSRAGDVSYGQRHEPHLTSFPRSGVCTGKVSGGDGPSGQRMLVFALLPHYIIITSRCQRHRAEPSSCDARSHMQEQTCSRVYVLCRWKIQQRQLWCWCL